MKFFKVKTVNTQRIGGIYFKYPRVTPSDGGGYVDVLKTLPWKNSSENTKEVPAVILEEYELSFGIWTNNLLRLLTIANTANQARENNKATDPYSSLYFGNPTGFKYILPYLIKPGTSIRGSIDNKWDQVNNPTTEMLGAIPIVGGMAKAGFETVQKAGSFVGNFVTPGYGDEPVYKYSGTAPRSISFSFPLYNTLDVDSTIGNFSFVSLFGIQNLKVRTSFLSYIPPKLYKVDSYGLGGLAIPAAYVSKFDVQSIGTTRNIDLGETGLGNIANLTGQQQSGNYGTLIPEAYKVSITLTELVPESANIMAGALGGDVVSVISK